MLLAKIILAVGVWIFLTVEVWCSRWIKKTGPYTVCIILATSTFSGVSSVLIARLIADLRMKQPDMGRKQPQTGIPKTTASYFEMSNFEVYSQNRVIEAGKKLAFRITCTNHGPMVRNDIAMLGSIGIPPFILSQKNVSEEVDRLRADLNLQKAKPDRSRVPLNIGDEVHTDVITKALENKTKFLHFWMEVGICISS